MGQPVTQEVILQAILELSTQVKENREEWKADIAEIKEWMVKTDERLETIDAKMDVFTKGLLDTQAEVVKLKKAVFYN